MSAPVRIEQRGAAWVLTVDRPETRNAIDVAVHDALAAAYEDAERAGARAVILTGAGDTFLSGGDLKVIRSAPFDETHALCRRMTQLLQRFAEEGSIPVLAAVNGHAFGGGCEVLVACDYRVAAPEAKLSFRQVAMGVSTGWGGARRLAQLVPRGVATRLLLAGEVLDAEEMRALGVVDELAADPVARCVALAEHIAAHPAASVAGLRRVIDAAYSLGPDDADAIEGEVFAELWGGPAHRAALAAFFAERSKP